MMCLAAPHQMYQLIFSITSITNMGLWKICIHNNSTAIAVSELNVNNKQIWCFLFGIRRIGDIDSKYVQH